MHIRNITTTPPPCCRALFEKLIVTQLVKKDPAFFMEPEGSVFTKPHRWTLSKESVQVRGALKHFATITIFYGEGLLARRPTPKLEDYPLSAVPDCLFNIFAATLRTRRTSLHPQPEDAPCRGHKGPTQHQIFYYYYYYCLYSPSELSLFHVCTKSIYICACLVSNWFHINSKHLCCIRILSIKHLRLMRQAVFEAEHNHCVYM
jgi:hypothetical protein